MRRLNVAMLFMALCLNLSAAEPNLKERSWSKTYKLSSVWRTIAVENRHGTLRIETWDRKEAKIDVIIRASADKESDIESLSTVVDVKLEETDRKLRADTSIQHRSKL